ncbi:tRNA lysidine(34) synthetase TilS [Ureaplasma miroungigenitalium]|uniref:tRNA(Ile)-lysidine synthase n=1 Tax=Ureaplasma miroungigenitalium TaxID=1042321 RepID=A0ABT3BMM5_9BACT|nr:tRNA lysidine(34) synthetase TilS [Ureaplasma miroungigenitalium]MCV3728493.1 tRNA lysidine(34) synthetase TilS [Ureaplasma miroungigenitalium]MCV3734280.1 tRNA lysidine(34) synthetase TilS [Ureaplasma miroungigenitalium]
MKKLWARIINLFKHKSYVAAVSGGPDSMAMLDMYRKQIKAVCHVNYHMREDSDNDMQIVEEYCHKYNIECYILHVDNNVLDKFSHINNFQAKARAIRYAFFAQIAREKNIDTVIVAHNQDDFLETAYMQKQRESKALFYGIRERVIINNVLIYRPVLKLRKSTLLRYCEEHDVQYAIDETNFKDIYERNQVRKTIASWDHGKIFNFQKEINKYNKEHEAQSIVIDTTYQDWVKKSFDYDFFKQLSDTQQYFLLFYFLNENKISNVSENKINGIMTFLNKKDIANKQYRLKDDQFLIINKQRNLEVIIDPKISQGTDEAFIDQDEQQTQKIYQNKFQEFKDKHFPLGFYVNLTDNEKYQLIKEWLVDITNKNPTDYDIFPLKIFVDQKPAPNVKYKVNEQLFIYINEYGYFKVTND